MISRSYSTWETLSKTRQTMYCILIVLSAAGNGHVQVLQWLVENGANSEY